MTAEEIKKLNTKLTTDIRAIINEVEETPPIWDETVKVWMSEVLADSVTRRILKFYRGQKEHGGNFLTKELNVVQMMQEESDDHFFYFERFKHDVRLMLARMERKEKR